MDEGKPAKGKWWSRPRPSASDGAPPANEPEGSFDPQGVRHDPEDTTPGNDSGDYVMAPARPAPSGSDEPAGRTTAAGSSEPGAEAAQHAAPETRGAADPEQAEDPADASPPEPVAPRPAGPAGVDQGGPADGARPTETERPAAGDPAAPMVSSQSADAVGDTDSADRPGQATPDGGAERADAGPAGGRVGPEAPAERPRPLHDPDPYGTPPYGEPGPWAPAPPVQHPGTTPAQGTPLPPPGVIGASGTPAAGTFAPATKSVAPVPAQAPPYGADPGRSAGYAAAGSRHGAAGAPYPAPVGPVTPWAGDPQGAPERAGSAPGGGGGHDLWNAPLHQNGAAPPPRRSRRSAALGVVAVALVAGLIGGALGSYLERTDAGPKITLPQADPESEKRAPDSVAGIAARALPSVVTLHVRGDGGQGTGTGFVLDGRGHILTNNHVIQPAGRSGEISVTFSGGQTAQAKVVGHDTGYDLAVVKVSNVSGLKPLPLGNSDSVQVGDPVVAIGAPFDLANTVTSGIISAKERPITTAGGQKGEGSDISYVDALQTDAPINPGNSGGPLVDGKARVIGINSAIRSVDNGQAPESGQAGSIGLGFAIPVNQAKRVAEELINTGSATHPVLGLTLDMNYSGDGARVADGGNDGGPAVNKGGPADKAGIRAGDILTRVDGAPVHSGEELIVKVRAHRPGDELELTVRHGDDEDGEGRKVRLKLGAAKGD